MFFFVFFVFVYFVVEKIKKKGAKKVWVGAKIILLRAK